MSIPIFSSVRKRIEKNFWDMEIIGNRRKKGLVALQGKGKARCQVQNLTTAIHRVTKLYSQALQEKGSAIKGSIA